ncbi:hypothetical protein DYB26_000445 [Aphanomyces astaci]|uniref:RUN domain-containing protein n=2 Tax=Aphanomyces astaci TaxID=112090 RepID=A0A3R6XVG2_APHAT|nr:hypothetical protein DYB26_000445 [Aphanomyces astaci]
MVTSSARRIIVLALGVLAWTLVPTLLRVVTHVAVALVAFLILASVQSLMEMSRIVHTSLLSTAAAEFYFGRFGSYAPSAKLLHVGFRPDSIRRVPPSAYLHVTYGLDKSVADELGTLVNILVADFVTFWYKQLTSDELFASTVKLLLCDILGGLSVRARRAFHLHGTLSAVTESLQVVQLQLAWFRDLYAELCDEHPHAFGDDSHPSLELRRRLVLDVVVGQHHSKLHPGALDSCAYLKQLSMNMLALVRPDFDDKCNPQQSFVSFPYLAWHFTSEILARCVLTPLISFCNPEHSNPLVASMLEPFQVRELELDTKAKRPLASYTASRAPKCSFDDAQLVNHLVSLMGELDSPESSGPQLLFPLVSSAETANSTAAGTSAQKLPLPQKSKHKKTRSLLDVAKMKARFSKRLASNASDRSSTDSAVDVNEFSKYTDDNGDLQQPQHQQPSSIGHDIVQQVDHAIGLYVALDPVTLLTSGRTKELHALVSSLEEVLLFGFKASEPPPSYSSTTLPLDDASYWTYLSQRRLQTAFWNDRVKLVQSLPVPRASDGHFSARGVQWLLLALEEGELWEYFTAMAVVESSVTDSFYESYAVLRDKELTSILLAALFRLNGMRVALHLQTLGHDRLTLSKQNLHSTETLAFGVTFVVEEAWECQRYLPLQGWLKSSDKRKRDDARLPTSEWVWDGPWTLEENPEIDGDGGNDSDDNIVSRSETETRSGWLYSKTSKHVGLHAKESRLDCVRRRKWLRRRKTLPLVLVPAVHPLHGAIHEVAPRSNQDKEPAASPTPDDKTVAPLQDRTACQLCHRLSMEDRSTFTCPRCACSVCFSCSNHCVTDTDESTLRVCATCYDAYAAQLRLRLTARATLVVDHTMSASDVTRFDLHVTTGDGHHWTGRKSQEDFDLLKAALCADPDIDPSHLTTRSSLVCIYYQKCAGG